jgi:serine/threonine protein kinase
VTGPWVAAVVDADPDAPTPWLATQYIRGPSLGNAVETLGPLDAGTVHVLAHGLALALTAVHQAGLVHRDLKPSKCPA